MDIIIPTAMIFTSYILFLLIHRTIIGPLAKVPGPRLAAFTGWYEVYFDLVQPARFPWQIAELHRVYGTVF